MNKNIHPLARAIIILQNKMLLCKNMRSKPSFYFLPGGHIEHDESAATTIIRELKEEGQLDIKVKRFLGCLECSFEPQKDTQPCHTHEYNFLFEAMCDPTINTNMPIIDVEDHIELHWVPLSHLDQIDLKPGILKTLIPKWLKVDVNHAFESSMQTF